MVSVTVTVVPFVGPFPVFVTVTVYVAPCCPDVKFPAWETLTERFATRGGGGGGCAVVPLPQPERIPTHNIPAVRITTLGPVLVFISRRNFDVIFSSPASE
jgi:hypothetical protein